MALEKSMKNKPGFIKKPSVKKEIKNKLYSLKELTNNNKLAKIIIMPDTHFPYEDKKAWKLFLMAAKGFAPDIFISLGDLQDNYQLSFHEKDLKKRMSYTEELAYTNSKLDEIDSLNIKKKIIVFGNHDIRHNRVLSNDNLREKLFPLIESGVVTVKSVAELLKLKQRGWEYKDYREHYQLGKLFITHEAGMSGPLAAIQAEQVFSSNVVIGHVHAMTYAVKGNMKGSAHVASSFGWLGDMEEMSYMSKAAATRRWSHGFGYGYMDTEGNVYLVPAPIVNSKCVVEGKLYKL